MGMNCPPSPLVRTAAWANTTPIYPPLEFFGPVRGLFSPVLCFAQLPVGGVQNLLSPQFGSLCLLLLLVHAHALSLWYDLPPSRGRLNPTSLTDLPQYPSINT